MDLASRVKSIRDLMLPRSDGATQRASGPLVVAGMFQTASGVGQVARRFVSELQARGLDPVAVDLSGLFNQVDMPTAITLSDMPDRPGGTLILAANAPETRLALRALKMRRWKHWRIIGYWAWELETAPAPWLDIARHLSELWVPSDFVAGAFRDHLDIPVRTVPIPVSAPPVTPAPPPADATMRCLTMADGRSSFHRKNLIAAAQAFTAAFGEHDDAELTIKIRNGREFPDFLGSLQAIIADRAKITLIDKSVSHAERWDMINRHAVMFSAHRAEGFGLHLAEAMALGKVAVATGWSGNTQFMTADNSILLPYRLEPVCDPSGIYAQMPTSRWARVDEGAAATALRKLYDEPTTRRALGLRAQQDIAVSLNSDALINALALPR